MGFVTEHATTDQNLKNFGPSDQLLQIAAWCTSVANSMIKDLGSFNLLVSTIVLDAPISTPA